MLNSSCSNVILSWACQGNKVQMNVSCVKLMTELTTELLAPIPRKAQQATPLVVTFHPDLPHLSDILHEWQCLINVSQRLKGTLPEQPIVVYRRPPNLRSLLVRAALRKSSETYRRNSWCGQPWCKMCAHIKTGFTFHTFTTNMEFRVKATSNCRTKNVVYLVEQDNY